MEENTSEVIIFVMSAQTNRNFPSDVENISTVILMWHAKVQFKKQQTK